MLKRYRRRVYELGGTLGIDRKSEEFLNFYPKFNKRHLVEELREIAPVIPEDQKPMQEVRMLIKGIGFKAILQSEVIEGKEVQQIFLRLGHQFDWLKNIPDNVTVTNGDIKKNAANWHWVSPDIRPTDCQELVFRSKDKHGVTQFAAQIQELRKPEPYKLKGIYTDLNNGVRRTRFKRAKRKRGK